MKSAAATSPAPLVESRILLIRGQKVLLDSDLAELYGVTTGRLNEAVKRNKMRFPADFMFRLTRVEVSEVEVLRSQNAILEIRREEQEKRGRHRKYSPYVFTEQGIAMLSSVLNSRRAIAVNISIMRTFVRLRQILVSHQEIATRLEQVEWRQSENDAEIKRVFEVIQEFIDGPAVVEPKRRIGFS
jgi:hypothetical protein